MIIKTWYKVSELMEYGRVITTHVLERGHGWHLYLILCRDIECLVTADANICQCCRNKGTRRVLGYDCFGHFFFREFLDLRDIEDGKRAVHKDFSLILVSLVKVSFLAKMTGVPFSPFRT